MKKTLAGLFLLLGVFFVKEEAKGANTYTDLIYSSSTVAGTVDIGRQSGVQESQAIRYIPQSDTWMCQFKIALRKVNTPAWGVVVVVRNGGSSPETGTPVESWTIPASAVSSTMSNVTVDLTECLWRSALSVTWIEIQGESNEVANYYQTNYGSINVNELPTQSWIRRAVGATFWSSTTTPGGMMGFIYGSNGNSFGAACTNLADCAIDPSSTIGLVLGLGPTSTSITVECPDFGIFTPICDAVIWFFVPNPVTIAGQVSSTISTIKTKFPFSYINSVSDAFRTSAAETSSTTYAISLDFTGAIPTTSSFGNFMGGPYVLFSASTVQQYVNPTIWATLKTLMALATYFATVEMIYYGVLGMLTPKARV